MAAGVFKGRLNMEFYSTIDELPLTDADKMKVLMWFARKVWDAQQRHDKDYHCKSYDPLQLEMSASGAVTGDSYVFDFWDGGRHHVFENLRHVEKELCIELWNVCDEGYTCHAADYKNKQALAIESRKNY